MGVWVWIGKGELDGDGGSTWVVGFVCGRERLGEDISSSQFCGSRDEILEQKLGEKLRESWVQNIPGHTGWSRVWNCIV